MSQSTAKSEPTRGRPAGDDLELGAAEALSRQADDCRRAGAARAAQREVSAMHACHADNNGQAAPRSACPVPVGVPPLGSRPTTYGNYLLRAGEARLLPYHTNLTEGKGGYN